MALRAPEDRKSSKARTKWLLRQLAASEPADLYVKAVWPGRRAATQESLAAVRNDADVLQQSSNATVAPNTFEVRLVRDAGARFAGAKTFVDELEKSVLRFYGEAGQRLRNWQPVAPKMVDKAVVQRAAEAPREPAQVSDSTEKPDPAR